MIPCYREAQYLAEAIESALLQTSAVREVIVIDDGSPIPLSKPEIALHPSVKWIRTSNRGLGAARNTGIQNCSGEFIAFLDADDKWHREKVQRQEQCLDEQTDSVACFTHCMDEVGFFRFGPYPTHVQTRQEMAAHLWRELYFPPSTLMVRSCIMRASGGFVEGLRNGEDLEIYIKLLKYGRISEVANALVWYRVHASQISSNEIRRVMGGKKAREIALREHGEFLETAGITKENAWKPYRDSVLLTFYRRNFKAARVLLWDYWKSHPGDFQILKYLFISLLPPKLIAAIRS